MSFLGVGDREFSTPSQGLGEREDLGLRHQATEPHEDPSTAPFRCLAVAKVGRQENPETGKRQALDCTGQGRGTLAGMWDDQGS